MRAAPRTISALLNPSPRFHRSVAIERDRHDDTASQAYVVTPWLEKVSRRIIAGLLPDSTRRAWRVTGDYGVGKSALALAILQALDPRTGGPPSPMTDLARSLPAPPPRMYPLVISGSATAFQDGLARAVAEAAAGECGRLLAKERLAVNAQPVAALLALRDAVIDGGEFDGLLLVMDEMGKFLEGAAAGPETGDIIVLQELAEAATRSGARPLALVLLLHQGVQSYAADGAVAMRSEWAKVAERFDEVVFDQPLTHTAALVAAALGLRADRLPDSAVRSYEKARAMTAGVGWLGPRSEHVGGAMCYPLHPSCIPVISRFFAAYGQNERSLFSFLASEDASGVRAFADQPRPGDALYRLDRFFDFVAAALGHRLVARSGNADWARIRDLLDGVTDNGPVEASILKITGLLNLLDAPDLIADVNTLSACLSPEIARREIAAAVAGLRRRGLLFERAARMGLRLWTSRRVDLSRVWEEAASQVPTAEVAREAARLLCALPMRSHLLARRHSVEQGTTRRFAVRFAPVSSLATIRPAERSDGRILAVLPRDASERRHAYTWAAEATSDDPALAVLVAPPPTGLVPTLTDLGRHRWIAAHAPELREDAVAAAEVERRVADLERLLVDRLERLLGLAGAAPLDDVAVFRGGRRLDQPAAVHVLVSEMCDELYAQAPIVANEIINRHALTSAAAGARQRLIELMFANDHEPELGLNSDRNPPERSLYLSLLRRGRVHRVVRGSYVIDVPSEGDDPLRLAPTLNRLMAVIVGAGERVGLSAIYEELRTRPYGVRAGVAPLLLAVVMVANRHRIALYERGTYCPRLDGQAFMRILKAPENFEVQWIELAGVRADVYRRAAAMLGEGSGGTGQGLLSVVAPLVRFGTQLNFYVQRTDCLSAAARAVRAALARSGSPSDLLFADLPRACGLPGFAHGGASDPAAAVQFVDRLQEAIDELRACYHHLLSRMREDMAAALNESHPARDAVLRRYGGLVFRVREQALRAFLQRLCDTVPGDDAWIEAIAGMLLAKPPARWLPQDEAMWRVRLDEAAGSLLRVEAAAFGSLGASTPAVRLAITHVDGREYSSVVAIPDASHAELLFSRSILRLIRENGTPVERILAHLATEVLGEEAAAHAIDAEELPARA